MIYTFILTRRLHKGGRKSPTGTPNTDAQWLPAAHRDPWSGQHILPPSSGRVAEYRVQRVSQVLPGYTHVSIADRDVLELRGTRST